MTADINNSPAPSDPDYKHFEIRRKMIVHEDHQINHRITVLLTTQSILFAGAAVTLTSSYRALPGALVENRISFLVTLLATAGIIFSLVMLLAITAARKEQELLRAEGKPGRNSDGPESKYDMLLPCGEYLKQCLQASNVTFSDGYSYTGVLCWSTASLWAILIVCLWLGLV